MLFSSSIIYIALSALLNNVPKVDIIEANIVGDYIELNLNPGNICGILTVSLVGFDSGGVYEHIILKDVVGSGNVKSSFNIPKLPEVEFHTLNVNWSTDYGFASSEFPVHVKVLGVYRHSQYNCPHEEDPSCTGIYINSFLTSEIEGVSQCFQRSVDFLKDDLYDPFRRQVELNGSGKSSKHNEIVRDGYCRMTTRHPKSINPKDIFRRATIKPGCQNHALSNETVAVCRKHSDLVCGDTVYIYGVGIKTVTDYCPACCAQDDMKQLDNYNLLDGRCTGLNDLGNFMTIKLFEE